MINNVRSTRPISRSASARSCCRGRAANFLEEMTGLHPAGEHGCNAAQNIWPIGDDGGFADAVARQALQFFWDSLRVKDMQPLGGEVADAGVEQIAKQ